MIAEIGDSARDWYETKKTAIKTGNVIPNTSEKTIWKLTSNLCILLKNMKLTSNE